MNTNGKNITHSFGHLGPTWCRTFKTDLRASVLCGTAPKHPKKGSQRRPFPSGGPCSSVWAHIRRWGGFWDAQGRPNAKLSGSEPPRLAQSGRPQDPTGAPSQAKSGEPVRSLKHAMAGPGGPHAFHKRWFGERNGKRRITEWSQFTRQFMKNTIFYDIWS